jgi:hypothetical protein
VKVPVKDVTLYAVCLENLHVRFETNARLIPFYGDQGEHADINPYWGELSCMYTLWNDCADPFFGIVNYRRNWEERYLSQLEDDTLYIPRHVTFPFSVQKQFSQGHGGGLDETVEMSLELARDKRIPLTEEMLLEMWGQPKFFETLQVMGPMMPCSATSMWCSTSCSQFGRKARTTSSTVEVTINAAQHS